MKNAIYFLLILAIVSCKKNALKHTSVDGKVKNAVNGAYMPNVPVKLIGSIGGFDFQGAETIATTTTDANGHFTFDLKGKSNQDYYVTIDHNNYEVYSESSIFPQIVNFLDITRGTINIIELTPATFGWVKLIVNGSGINDSLDIRFYHETFIPINSNMNYWKYQTGIYSEFSGFSEKFIGNNILDYIIYNNGIGTQYLDTINVQQGEYYTKEIVF